MLAVAVSAHTYVASLAAEASLSHELQTPLASETPATPVVVGDSWQNRRLRPLIGYGDGIAPPIKSIKM